MRWVSGGVLAASTAIALTSGAVAESFGDRVGALRAAAAAAYETGDVELARRNYEANLALQPGHLGLAAQLALINAEQGEHDAAARLLERIAGAGLSYAPEGLRAELGEAADYPAIAEALARMENNLEPFGLAESIATIDDPDALVEGVAVASDGRIFVSAVVGRAILVGSAGGGFSVFADSEDNLQSVFGLAIDDERGALWAVTGVEEGVTPLNEGEAPASALVAFDLETGEERVRLEAPEDAGARLADFTLAPDGALYVADSEKPRIYRAADSGSALELFVESDAFMSVQGMAVVGDALFAADYGRGLFRIDLTEGSVTAMRAPADASLLGIDGLAANGDRLIAVQNGVRPNRVIEISLSVDGRSAADVRVLASGSPEFDDPTLGVVDGDRFVFIANSQWPRFLADEPEPRDPTHVMAIELHP